MKLYKIFFITILCIILPIASAEKINNDRIFKQKVQEHKAAIKNGNDLIDMMAKRLDKREPESHKGKNGLHFMQAFVQSDYERKKELLECYGTSLLNGLNEVTSSYETKLNNAIALDCICRLVQLQLPMFKINVTESAMTIMQEDENEIKKQTEKAKNIMASAKTTKIICDLHSFMSIPFACGVLYGIYNKDNIVTGLTAAGLGLSILFPWLAKKYVLSQIIINDPITDENAHRQNALMLNIQFYPN